MKEVLSIEWMTRDQNERISGAIEQERRRNSRTDAVSWDFGDVPLPLGEGGAKRRVRAGIAPSSGPSGHLLPEGEGHERRGGHFREDHSVHAKFHTDLQILEFRISNFQCSRPPTQDL